MKPIKPAIALIAVVALSIVAVAAAAGLLVVGYWVLTVPLHWTLTDDAVANLVLTTCAGAMVIVVTIVTTLWQERKRKREQAEQERKRQQEHAERAIDVQRAVEAARSAKTAAERETAKVGEKIDAIHDALNGAGLVGCVKTLQNDVSQLKTKFLEHEEHDRDMETRMTSRFDRHSERFDGLAKSIDDLTHIVKGQQEMKDGL